MNRGNARANRYQAIWLITLSLCLLDYLFKGGGIYLEYPNSIYLLSPLWSLSPVFYYFYFCEFNGNSRSITRHWFHFIPFAAAIIVFAPFILLPADEKVALVLEQTINDASYIRNWRNTISVIYVFQGLFYSALVIRVLSRNIAEVLNLSASPSVLQGMWVRRLVFCYTGYLLLELIYGLVAPSPELSEMLVALILAICASVIHLVGWVAIAQPEQIFPQITEVDEVVSSSPPDVHFGDAQVTKSQLTRLIQSRELYKIPDLQVSSIAAEMNMSTRNLSRFINQEMQTTFFDLINTYRVDEACQRLSQEELGSILDVAMNSGFQSKSSFNRIFKKQKGITPTAFRKVSMK